MNLHNLKQYAYYICSTNKVFDDFDRIYPFTTENIHGYFNKEDIENKQILTVGSSLDHAINSFLMGSNDITIFDVNPFVKFYADLKIGAIKALELEEFLKFICYFNYPKNFYKNNNSFNIDTFNKIKEYLPSDSLYFWEYLYKNFKSKCIRQRLFTSDEYSKDIVSKINNYLTNNSYNELKYRINEFKPKFIESSLLEIDKKLTSNFDTIYLSNISHYLRDYDFSLIKFRDNIIKLYKYLNNNGKIFFAYLYDMNEETKVFYNWDPIYKLDMIKKIFKDEYLGIQTFESIISDIKPHQDTVLYLKK